MAPFSKVLWVKQASTQLHNIFRFPCFESTTKSKASWACILSYRSSSSFRNSITLKIVGCLHLIALLITEWWPSHTLVVWSLAPKTFHIQGCIRGCTVVYAIYLVHNIVFYRKPSSSWTCFHFSSVNLSNNNNVAFC